MPLNLKRVNPPARVEAAQQRIPQHPKSDSGTGGGTVNHYSVPPNGPQTGSDALKPSTSIHSRLHVPMRPPVQTRPPPTPPQSDWAKERQLTAVKLREWHTQIDAARNNEEIQKAMEKYHSRMGDLSRNHGGGLDKLEQSDNNDMNPSPPALSSRPALTTMPLNTVDPPSCVETIPPWIPPWNTNFDTGTGGSCWICMIIFLFSVLHSCFVYYICSPVLFCIVYVFQTVSRSIQHPSDVCSLISVPL